MKKLILLLTLTMMFGQTKLETRLYSIELNLLEDIDVAIDFSDITGYDLDSPILFLKSIDNMSPLNSTTSVEYSAYEDAFDGRVLTYIKEEGTLYNQEHCTPYPDTDYINLRAQWGSVSGTFNFAITAEFPQEDTGYIEDGFDYCVEPGANLMSYPCDSAVALLDAIPSDALSQFSGIIGQGIAATQLPNGTWIGSLTAMQASSGYWIQSNTSLCFNYDCSEN